MSLSLAVAGCESLPDISGMFFDGNHPAEQPAAFDVLATQPNLTLHFSGVTLKDAHTDPGSNAIALQLDGTADAGMFADVQRRTPDWIVGTQVNGDTATIVARSDVEFVATPDKDGFNLTLKPRVVASAAPAAAPTVPVQTEPLRGEAHDGASDPVDGMQRAELRGAFGPDDKPVLAGSNL